MPHKKNLTTSSLSATVQLIERRIYLIRSQKVMIDADLAELYGVPTSRLNEEVSRNKKRFPEEFMFRLTKEEAENLRSQFAISRFNLRSQIATSSLAHGGRRYPPRTLSTHDKYFKLVFDELKKLTDKPVSSGRQIGFKGRS
jgi:hypothetical protein